MTIDDVLMQLEQDISAAHEALKGALGKLRTGRANISTLDPVRVSAYGSMVPLAQCAQLSVLDARMLGVKPWDKSLIGEIEKAILASDLGIMPQNDGEMIRLPFPQPTQERRRELAKTAKMRGEESKIGLRNHRRDANDKLKDLEKEKAISQDELKRALEQVSEKIAAGSGIIDDLVSTKDKEIMSI